MSESASSVLPGGLPSDEIFPVIYTWLREAAAVRLRKEAEPASIDPTELVHEVYLRFAATYRDRSWESRREV
ncbi:MAG: hypothetical protein KDA58_16170, partial [Planctomycetaceae bacterium]|nr:hypothetical protein [Planctomycetaceae bacterium]